MFIVVRAYISALAPPDKIAITDLVAMSFRLGNAVVTGRVLATLINKTKVWATPVDGSAPAFAPSRAALLADPLVRQFLQVLLHDFPQRRAWERVKPKNMLRDLVLCQPGGAMGADGVGVQAIRP